MGVHSSAGEAKEKNAPTKMYALLSDEASARADAFERERIMGTVKTAWTPELTATWREYCKSFKVRGLGGV